LTPISNPTARSAKLVVLNQCGHVPEIEKPQEFNQALNQCGHVPEIEKPQEFNQALLDFPGSP